MLVVILICAANLELRECTDQTARAVIKVHAEQIGCAGPSMAGPLVSATGVGEQEYARIRCTMR
jgi:hypothetical protein